MKKMFKIVLALLMSAAVLSGCSSKPAETTTTSETTGETTSAGEKQEVVIWHTYTEDQQKCLEDAATAFNESQDAVTVTVQSQAYQDFTSKVMQAVRAGNGPDIIIHYSSEAANYVNDGLVADLGQYVDADYESTVNAASYQDATSFSDGKMHIYPVITTGPVFLYNKTIYDELGLTAPTTWTELQANCEAIKAKYSDKYGFAFDSLADGMQTLFLQTGSGYIDVDTKSVKFNTPENVERLQWYADNVQNGNFMLEPTDQYFSNDMNAGTLVSYIGSIAGIPYLTLPEGQELAAAALPQEGSTQWAPAWFRGGIVFSSTPEREAAAVEFLKFFTSPEWNAKFCEAANYLTPYTATTEEDSYKAFVEGSMGTDLVKASYDDGVAGALENLVGASTVRNALIQAATEAATNVQSAADALTTAETTSNAELQAN